MKAQDLVLDCSQNKCWGPIEGKGDYVGCQQRNIGNEMNFHSSRDYVG